MCAMKWPRAQNEVSMKRWIKYMAMGYQFEELPPDVRDEYLIDMTMTPAEELDQIIWEDD